MKKVSCRYVGWSVFLICVLLLPGGAHAARIRLTSGGSIKGDIDRQTGDEIHVRVIIVVQRTNVPPVERLAGVVVLEIVCIHSL